MKIHLTLLIYINEGQEDIFHEFEKLAIPIISKYKGKLLLRLRPNESSVIENNVEIPYEIHHVEFESEEDFICFSKGEDRKQFLHLKEKSIRESILIKGNKL